MKLLSKVAAGTIPALVLWAIAGPSIAQTRVEENVVYGMYYGASLTMDIYHADESNARGVFLVHGSGWHGFPGYSAPALKELNDNTRQTKDALVASGFTVFVPNHRQAPAFRWPVPYQDVARAVRFVRSRAAEYGVSPTTIGALGTSSGGHLVGHLALQDGIGDNQSGDPIDALGSKVQAAVMICSSLDFMEPAFSNGFLAQFATSLIGEPSRLGDGRGEVSPAWSEAQPVTHLTSDDPPFLVIHARDDFLVPYQAAETSVQALSDTGIPVEFVTIEEGGHCPDVDDSLIAAWLTEQLVN